MDADRETAPLEHRQCREDRRDGPAGHRDELVDRRPAEDDLAAETAGDLADIGSASRPRRPGRRARPAWSARPRSSMSCGMPGDDPGALRELAQERQAARRRGASMRPGHEEALATLLERPRRGDQRAAPGRRLDHDRRVGQTADDPVAPREGARGSGAMSGAQLRHDRPTRRDDRIGQPAVGTRDGGRRVPSR